MPEPHRRNELRHALTAVGAGLLVALALPPWGFWPLAFVGIALFEVSLGEFPTRRQRVRRGWLFGAGWMFPGLSFLWFLSAPGYIVGAAMFAGLHALAASVAPTGPWRVIGRPAAHTIVEAIRFVAPFGGVPLASLAIGQAGGPLLETARIGGAVLITWVTFQIGFALAGPSPYVPAMARKRGATSGAQLHGAIGFGLAVLVIVVASVAPSGSNTPQTLRIAAVQGGGPQGTRAINTRSRDVVERHLEANSSIEPGSVDLVLWPENVVDVNTLEGSVEFAEIVAEAQRIGAPLAIGVTDEAPSSDELGSFKNGQVVITPDGEIFSRYDKVRRVPYGEYVPLRGVLSALGAPVDQIRRDATAGTGPAYIDLPSGERLAVVISWEVFFGSRARDGVRHGAGLIINPTNGSSYTGTLLQGQQIASSRLRSIEMGRWVVQVSPTGFSAFVSSNGEVFDRTAVSEQKVNIREVPLRSGATWYSSLGDLPFVLAAILALVMSWMMPSRSRWRQRATARPSP